MYKHSSRILVASVFAALFGAPTLAAAQPPTLPVQGYLTDDEGAPLNGPTEMTFRLYDEPGATAALFEETQTIAMDSGAFSAQLGAVESLELALFQGLVNPHIGVQVGGDEELSPRLPIGTVGYASVAAFCGEADSVEGRGAADFAAADHAHAFSELTGIPADIADGDSDTTYSGADFATSDQSCGAGMHAIGIDTTGALQCAADEAGITTITAGAGLSGGGTGSMVTIDFAPTVSVFGVDMPRTEDFNSVVRRTLTPVANSVCFLTSVRFGDDNDEDDTNQCRVFQSSGTWFLDGRTNSNESTSSCGATCLQW